MRTATAPSTQNSAEGDDASVARPAKRLTASSETHALTSEIVGLLNEQAFSSGEARTEHEVCESFSKILLRHWDLCCVAVFLRDEGGRLQRCADFNHAHLDKACALLVGEALAEQVERAGEEFQFGLAEQNDGGVVDEGLRELFERAGLKAGVAVPILASGSIIGVLAVACSDTDRLCAALNGARCVGQAVVIALGNARRSAAMSEQRKHIESLVGELRKRTSALESANVELQRVSRYRSLFLERMSHELRTPLTSILGFAEILLDQEELTDTQRRFCGKIQSSGFQLQSSLNQLVDLSRLEAGHTELFLHEFSLRETLRESCAAVARLAQKQNVTLECETASEIGSIVSDEGKLRQVLYNFFAFAIGRSPAGSVVNVNATLVEDRNLRIEIADEGEPLQNAASLFEPVDIDAPNEHGTNMNELGLVIAHRLLDFLGGNVTLHERRPTGLSVYLNLPARPTKQ